MRVNLTKTREDRPSLVPEGAESRGQLQVIRYFNSNEERISRFGSDYFRKEIVDLTSIIQIEEGDQVLIKGDKIHSFIQTSPITEILEISEVDITFKTKTSEYVLRLI